jgi:hypothetical protein
MHFQHAGGPHIFGAETIAEANPCAMRD